MAVGYEGQRRVHADFGRVRAFADAATIEYFRVQCSRGSECDDVVGAQ